jgi:hypothetical protein
MHTATVQCQLCHEPVSLAMLHPDSDPLPPHGDFSAYHVGCANGEDAAGGIEVTDEQLTDQRAWIRWA